MGVCFLSNSAEEALYDFDGENELGIYGNVSLDLQKNNSKLEIVFIPSQLYLAEKAYGNPPS